MLELIQACKIFDFEQDDSSKGEGPSVTVRVNYDQYTAEANAEGDGFDKDLNVKDDTSKRVGEEDWALEFSEEQKALEESEDEKDDEDEDNDDEDEVDEARVITMMTRRVMRRIKKMSVGMTNLGTTQNRVKR